MNILVEKLKNMVKEKRDEGIPDNVIINSLKEELQYPILDFIYNSREYSHLIMYGGTLLRIGYDLSRMSEDLDFQTDKKFNFKKFRNDLIAYFKNTYDVDINVAIKSERLTGTDVATISFSNILEETGIKGYGLPTVLKIRVDVNFFSKASNFTTETIPKVKDTFAFSIKTYPASTLMASKVAAVLLRTKRGIGAETSDCKPRDIYDLIWYIGKKIIPDLEYLKAIHARTNKVMEARNILELFNALKRRVPNLDDKSFRQDLAPFFNNQTEYDEWHRNWRQRFITLINSYEIYEVRRKNNKPDLQSILVAKEFSTANRYFHYFFATEEPEKQIHFTCILSEYWYMWSEFRISGHRRNDIKFHTENVKFSELDYEYMGLFYTKIEDYIKRNDYIILQPELKTKVIRATADNLNTKKEIFLNRSLIVKERFEDLL
ncbi:hypothetical protein A3B60_00440 [Candidatus Peregrinibacteria bacterium RIFCSPLOWO2_01_FULL_39_12]|nr:MAG: hypothetical protein A3B60_00440 [Candidatus Peregrinibacteria bacterium RIFCSPLOWO2_01_FULL_39_12]OGJ42209.1 MAG: hypothetical protein A3I58_01185 [Candidatus Peregrinibacteria bacterium RIFCSPLOWO2_02_FULL_39_10]